jgi:hypothetical protein
VRILLVEDDVRTARAVERGLRLEGYVGDVPLPAKTPSISLRLMIIGSSFSTGTGSRHGRRRPSDEAPSPLRNCLDVCARCSADPALAALILILATCWIGRRLWGLQAATLIERSKSGFAKICQSCRRFRSQGLKKVDSGLRPPVPVRAMVPGGAPVAPAGPQPHSPGPRAATRSRALHRAARR